MNALRGGHIDTRAYQHRMQKQFQENQVQTS